MSLWKHDIDDVVGQLAGRHYRFLSVATPHPYVAILIELYRSRQEDLTLELPFDELYDRVVDLLEVQPPARIVEAVHLRKYLDQLQEWGNIAVRLEPRRIRRISDRGLERYLVRLLPETQLILGQLETRLDQTDLSLPAPAAFSLGDVNDALRFVVDLLESHAPIDPEEYVRVGRALGRTRRLLEEAGEDLLRLDLWLSELAMEAPESGRIRKLLDELEAYFERYLRNVDDGRRTCSDRVRQLQTSDAASFLGAVREASERELADDPTRNARLLPDYRMLVASMAEFLHPGGVLDQRRRVVHQRLAEVAGRLKRFLNDLLRRSQVVSQLQAASKAVMHANDSAEVEAAIDNSMQRMWQSGHAMFDGENGLPRDPAYLTRPHRSSAATRDAFAGATVEQSDKSESKPKQKPTMVARLDELNGFVSRAILGRSKSVSVGKAKLESIADVRQLIAAVRESRLRNSRLRQRSLSYKVSGIDASKTVTIKTADGSGELTLPALMFDRTQ